MLLIWKNNWVKTLKEQWAQKHYWKTSQITTPRKLGWKPNKTKPDCDESNRKECIQREYFHFWIMTRLALPDYSIGLKMVGWVGGIGSQWGNLGLWISIWFNYFIILLLLALLYIFSLFPIVFFSVAFVMSDFTD